MAAIRSSARCAVKRTASAGSRSASRSAGTASARGAGRPPARPRARACGFAALAQQRDQRGVGFGRPDRREQHDEPGRQRRGRRRARSRAPPRARRRAASNDFAARERHQVEQRLVAHARARRFEVAERERLQLRDPLGRDRERRAGPHSRAPRPAARRAPPARSGISTRSSAVWRDTHGGALAVRNTSTREPTA